MVRWLSSVVTNRMNICWICMVLACFFWKEELMISLCVRFGMLSSAFQLLICCQLPTWSRTSYFPSELTCFHCKTETPCALGHQLSLFFYNPLILFLGNFLGYWQKSEYISSLVDDLDSLFWEVAPLSHIICQSSPYVHFNSNLIICVGTKTSNIT